jgi:hypothetical protein
MDASFRNWDERKLWPNLTIGWNTSEMVSRRLLIVSFIVFAGMVLICGISLLTLYADVQRIGCESSGQLLGPASSSGHMIANSSQTGACFVTFLEFIDNQAEITQVLCREDLVFVACQGYREQVSSGWSNYLGNRCTSLAFVGGADCDCTETGEGCQVGGWPVEIGR